MNYFIGLQLERIEKKINLYSKLMIFMLKRQGIKLLPPTLLRKRVHGHDELYSYFFMGRKITKNIKHALKKNGYSIYQFKNILDFGCGCGRILIWFTKYARTCNLFGTDSNEEMIIWCQNNMPFGTYSVNHRFKPLHYESNTFDLVYAMSVFTHFSESEQFYWLEELKRIVKSEGIIILTLHGMELSKAIPNNYQITEENNGFILYQEKAGTSRDGSYQNNAFHTREYVYKHYVQHFKIIDYIEGKAGIDRDQDRVILQKRA